MALFKMLACLSVYFAFNIATSNGQDYTYIKNSLVDEVYAAAGYKSKNYIERFVAEGNAICRALEYIYTIYKYGFQANDEIEVIVASTDMKTLTYIYGMAERLTNTNLPKNQKPSKIVVVYTLNYVIELTLAVKEHNDLKAALQKLIDAGAMHDPKIEVEVKQFRPVANKVYELVDRVDLPKCKEITMTIDQRNVQCQQIDDLHAKIQETEFINSELFYSILKVKKVRLVVDGVLGIEDQPIDGNNQLLTAIQIAQVRIMAIATLERKHNDAKYRVFCIDNPSGMNEDGKWTIPRYHVDIILSRVWNKRLVNSGGLTGWCKKLVLDITYKGTRLFDTLLGILSSAERKSDPKLIEDITVAQRITGRTVAFMYDDGSNGIAFRFGNGRFKPVNK